MIDLNKTVLKEFLLKAYQTGFNDGTSTESDSQYGMDYTSSERKEVLRNEDIENLYTDLVKELEHQLEYSIRLKMLDLKIYDREEKNKLVEKVLKTTIDDLVKPLYTDKKISEMWKPS